MNLHPDPQFTTQREKCAFFRLVESFMANHTFAPPVVADRPFLHADPIPSLQRDARSPHFDSLFLSTLNSHLFYNHHSKGRGPGGEAAPNRANPASTD